MKKIPAVRMLVTVGIGLPLGRFLSPESSWQIAIVMAVLLLVLVAVASVNDVHVRSGNVAQSGTSLSSAVPAAVHAFCLVVSGAFIGFQIRDGEASLSASSEDYSPAMIEGIVLSTPEDVGGTLRFSVNGVLRSPVVPTHTARIAVHCFGPVSKCPTPGDIIKFAADVRAPVHGQTKGIHDESSYHSAHRTWWIARVKASSMSIQGRREVLSDPVERSRTVISSSIDRLFRPEYREFSKSLLLGADSDLDRDLRDSFVRTGTAHILAVSGMHVSVLAMILAVFLTPITSIRVRSWILVAVVVFYVILCGSEPSAVRAAAMVILWDHLRRVGRLPGALNVLSFLALVFIVVTPTVFLSIGFRLSFAAVSGILLFGQRASELCIRLLPAPSAITGLIRESMAMTISASIFVTPVVAWHFQSLSLISVLSNIIAVPLSVAATLGIALSLSVGMVWNEGAVILSRGSEALLFACSAWCDALAAVPGIYQVRDDAMELAFIFTLLFLFLLRARTRRSVMTRSVLVIAFTLIIIISNGTIRPPESLRVAKHSLRVQRHAPSTLVLTVVSTERDPSKVFSILLPVYRRHLIQCADTLVLWCEDSPQLRSALRSFDAVPTLTIGHR